MFPRVPDQHKPNKPLVPNGLGILYVLFSVTYLFLIYFQNLDSKTLILAVCILFGGFMGLLDDWMDIKWRYKAFLPLIAAIPLISLAYGLQGARTSMMIPILGTIDFGIYYYILVLPLFVTIITNTVNQLGGLNGLETICPAIVMFGLMVTSGSYAVLLLGPLAIWLLLAFQNLRGKIFVGNSGSFAIGMTLVAFAIISNLKLGLVISILPYVFNSAFILLTFFFLRKKANVSFNGKGLSSDHARSLITLITYHRQFSERQVVFIISSLVAIMTIVASLIQWLAA